jgi:SagB-type dehydrogenase family enzyme
MDLTHAHREFMKSLFGSAAGAVASDQSKGVPEPPLETPCPDYAERIPLPAPDKSLLSNNDLFECILARQSRRRWTPDPLSLAELSFLLWATQGVKEVIGDNYATMRTVPSGGARHAFETYLVANRVDGILPGVYRYRAVSHEIAFLHAPANLRDLVMAATFNQRFVAEAPVLFLWSCVPYRAEWRYTTAAHKLMLLDAGHMCQNLYLACEAIGAGTCAIGAYYQPAVDALLQLDGEDEFVIYLAPVGKVAKGRRIET